MNHSSRVARRDSGFAPLPSRSCAAQCSLATPAALNYQSPVMPKQLQFWFDFASTYSYVAALRVQPLCEAAGLTINYKPFLLGPIFVEQLGIKDSPFNAHPIRGRYMWRDLERLCGKYSLPWRRPTTFPRNSILA